MKILCVSAAIVAGALLTSSAQAESLYELADVAEGSFVMGKRIDEMGNAEELPRHEVRLDPYRIGRYEVTNAQYAAVLNWALSKGLLAERSGAPYRGGAEGEPDPRKAVYAFGKILFEMKGRSEKSTENPIQYSNGNFTVRDRDGRSMDDHPVVLVSWYGAVAFCNWLSEMEGLAPCYDLKTWTPLVPLPNGYRLPTEPEWERAACWDASANPSHWLYGFQRDMIDFAGCNYNKRNPLGLSVEPYTTFVGYYNGVNTGTLDSRSPVGCYDMSGNVEEWCHDPYTDYATGKPFESSDPQRGPLHAVRGGSWFSPAYMCHAGRRSWIRFTSDYTSTNIGFRLARSGVGAK